MSIAVSKKGDSAGMANAPAEHRLFRGPDGPQRLAIARARVGRRLSRTSASLPVDGSAIAMGRMMMRDLHRYGAFRPNRSRSRRWFAWRHEDRVLQFDHVIGEVRINDGVRVDVDEGLVLTSHAPDRNANLVRRHYLRSAGRRRWTLEAVHTLSICYRQRK